MPLVEWYPAEQRAEQSGLAGSVRAGHGDPVRPVDLQVDRAEGERAAPDDGAAECDRRHTPRRTTAPRSVATIAPALGAAAISIRRSHSFRGSSTTSRRSISRSVWRAFAACFSVASVRNLRPILSLSGCLRRAFLTPFSIQARCDRARSCRLARVPAYSS